MNGVLFLPYMLKEPATRENIWDGCNHKSQISFIITIKWYIKKALSYIEYCPIPFNVTLM